MLLFVVLEKTGKGDLGLSWFAHNHGSDRRNAINDPGNDLVTLIDKVGVCDEICVHLNQGPNGLTVSLIVDCVRNPRFANLAGN
jgi:hypothetical protein